MAHLQPMHSASQVFVQGSAAAAAAAQMGHHHYPHSSIPYHIYQNVVLAALNTSSSCSSNNQQQEAKPQLKTELLDSNHLLDPNLFKSDHLGTVTSAAAGSLLPISTAHSHIKSEMTMTSPTLLQPPQVLQPSHVEALQPADTLPLQPLQQQQQQQQFLMPLSLSLPTAAPVQQQQQQQPQTPVSQVVKKKRGKSSKGSSDKIHSCPECSYTCNRADKLKVHIKGVHNNDKPFPCEFCGKGFKQRDKLSRHTNTVHYRERPFACDYCPLAFGRKDKVKRHVSTVHLMERPYRCNFCSHNTTRKDKMRIHLQQVHQSVDGSEHYIVERQPQPPPRVLTANTNRNIGDIVGNQTTSSTAASSSTTSTTTTTATDQQQQLLGCDVIDSSNIANMVSLTPATNSLVSNVMTNLVGGVGAAGALLPPPPPPSGTLSFRQAGEENSQNAINNGVPIRVVTKL